MPHFRTLTIRQPYALMSCLPTTDLDSRERVLPVKDVENRSRSTPHRGIILIHTGTKQSFNSECRQDLVQFFDEGLLAGDLDLHHGGFLGFAELVDVVRTSSSRWAESGEYHWTLRNPTLMPFVAAKGKLNLWSAEWPWTGFIPGTNKKVKKKASKKK